MVSVTGNPVVFTSLPNHATSQARHPVSPATANVINRMFATELARHMSNSAAAENTQSQSQMGAQSSVRSGVYLPASAGSVACSASTTSASQKKKNKKHAGNSPAPSGLIPRR